tara:strand:+ start:819 stop:1460 length:642 start_codon:yes stop_codon:yes gene_type:complete
MAIDENEQRLKDQLRMIEMGETLEDLNDPEEYEDQGGINSLRKAPSIKLASETGAEEFELELSTVIAEYNDLTSKGDPAVRGISLDQFIDNYFSKKKMMKMMEEDRATVMGGGMMRMNYADGTDEKEIPKRLSRMEKDYPDSMKKKYNFMDVVDKDKEDEYYKIKEEKMLRKYYPEDYPPSQRTMGMEELRKMINKAEKDKKKLAMGGIAGVL